MAAFPQPLGAHIRPPPLRPLNSPAIQVSTLSISILSSGMAEPGVPSGKRKEIRTGATPAFPQPLGADIPACSAAPELTVADPRQDVIDLRGVDRDVCTGCHFCKEQENPHGGNASFPTPTRCGRPPATSADHRLTADPREQIIDVLRDGCARCRCWKSKTIPSEAVPALPPGADSLPPALQPPNSPPDSSAAVLQVSGAVVGRGHTGAPRRTVEGPGRSGPCGGQLSAGCGGSPCNTAPGRSSIGCWGCCVPATRGCSQQRAGARGAGIPGFISPGRSVTRGNCCPPGGS